MRPKAATTSATIFFTAASSPVSELMSSTLTPLLPATSLAAAASAVLSRATMATLTPSRASSLAMALPMPRLPPVTIAVLPLRSRSMGRVLAPFVVSSWAGRTVLIDQGRCQSPMLMG